MIEHERYGNSEFNIIIDCIYKGESLQEFLDSELVDRGYDDLITVLEVKNGEMKKLYSSYNGEGKYFQKENFLIIFCFNYRIIISQKKTI